MNKKYIIFLLTFILLMSSFIFSQNRIIKEFKVNVVQSAEETKNIHSFSNNSGKKKVEQEISTANSHFGTVNLLPYKPSDSYDQRFNWSDCLVVTNDSSTYTDALTLKSSKDIFVSFAVLNNGTDKVTTKFWVEIKVNEISKYRGYYENLEANYYCYWIDQNIGKLIPGNYTFKMVIDPENNVIESNESDNVYQKTMRSNDYDPPVITHTPPISANYNIPLTITASAVDLGSGVSIFNLQYRKSGDLWEEVNKVNFVNNTASIPANFVTEKGVDYIIYAEDNNYNSDSYFNTTDQSPYVSVPVIVPNNKINPLTTTGGTDFNAYRLFSIPFNIPNMTANSFFSPAGTFKKDWRLLYLYKGGEFKDGETIPIEIGTSYFLITRNNLSQKPTGDVKTNNLSFYDYVGIPVKVGWNFIGNPFAYQIKASSLYLLDPSNVNNSTVVDAYEFTGKNGWIKADYLYPWEGVAIYSDKETKLQFWEGYSSLSYKNINELKNDNLNWVSKIEISNGNTSDQENFFGVQTEINNENRYFNKMEPPNFDGFVKGYFVNDLYNENSSKYSQDIKSIDENGYIWNFVVNSNEKFYLSFKNLDNIPNTFDKYLIDLENNIQYDLSKHENLYFSGSNKSKDFKILIGKKDFIKKNSNEAKEVPDEFSLSQNFPNPFNPTTKIQFSIPNNSFINLSVFDSYGRLVSTLINEFKSAGYYDIDFNASASKVGLSSGIYYYRIVLDGKLNQMKKMILMK